MENVSISDLKKIDDFRKKITVETDFLKKMSLVEEAIVFTDQFSMSNAPSLSKSGTFENIHCVAGYRSDFLKIKMELLFEKVMKLEKEGNREAVNECERDYLKCCRLFDIAISKCLETMKILK